VRLVPNIRFGTHHYPDKIARRLRAVNIVSWTGAGVILLFGVLRVFDKVTPVSWRLAAVNLISAAILMALPLLHRFSSVAAPCVLGLVSYGLLFVVSMRLGTATGVYFYYFSFTALCILFLGIERIGVTIVFASIATGSVVALHVFATSDTGVATANRLFYQYFAVNVAASSAILYGTIYYAVRQFVQAEALVEREYDRSETLLSNILPPHVAGRLRE
jgi:adenylate cyclase